MAFVHWPTEVHMKPMSVLKVGHPFIMEADGGYPDGVNWYLFERCRGRIDPSDLTKPRTAPDEPSHNSVESIVYAIANVLTWGETLEAHPSCGVLRWHQLKLWHVTELYSDALARGYWTQGYWETGIPSPLHPESTIQPRLNEILLCWYWMERYGLIAKFDEPSPLRAIGTAKNKANQSYATRSAALKETSPKKKQFRRNRAKPGDGVMPGMDHLLDWIERIPSETPRRAVLHILDRGLRIEEHEENTLLPGIVHARDLSHIRRDVRHYSWTDEPRLLKYSLTDDHMIGVLPDRKTAFSSDALISQRIIGKGKKIRLAHMTRGCAQALWGYADGTRRVILQRNGIKPSKASAHLFLNRDGRPLTAGALAKAISRANEDMSSPFRITAHVLRHLFACFFLKNAIEGHAFREGLTVAQLTYEQIEKIAENPARVLQLHLGHADFEDTAGYIKLLIDWWLTPMYFDMWNDFLDGQHA
ncbi:hypothetical protein DEM27_20290 [Metarhizobium album]|uniref:Tyr recombinase domain-containing protein n=2 Tax=Metarhizobium album TaxID=2182425 RepID=A0A2U2DMA6_9HYPH|nr:hypothetical protein DEM27_20290 [Rhizobium album]